MSEVPVLLYGLFGIIILLTAWFLLPYVARRWGEANWRSVCRDQGVIVLTFDDGPGSHLTLQIERLLQELGICASFFMIGNRAIKASQIVRSLARNGHDIGGHTAQHLNAWKSLPHAHCRDMIDGQRQIAELTGNTKLFRPAYGKMSLASFTLAKLHKLEIAWWTIDARDSLEDPRPHEEVLGEIRLNRGGVILLHDYDAYPNKDHDEYVLSLVRKIHALGQELNLRFSTISEFITLVQR